METKLEEEEHYSLINWHFRPKNEYIHTFWVIGYVCWRYLDETGDSVALWPSKYEENDFNDNDNDFNGFVLR